jgi:outer membrane receptor protein involved in Fe transport
VDKFGNLDKAVFSPRLSLMFKPTASQSIRASFNRAFRAPSVINNYLDLNILGTSTVLNFSGLAPLLPALGLLPPPFFLRCSFEHRAEGRHRAFELAYTGTISSRTTVGIALYQNTQDDNISVDCVAFPRRMR